jgi:hypothetical protein
LEKIEVYMLKSGSETARAVISNCIFFPIVILMWKHLQLRQMTDHKIVDFFLKLNKLKELIFIMTISTISQAKLKSAIGLKG